MKKNLLLLSTTIVVTLLICELIVRAIGYERMTTTPLTGFHEYDGELGWKLIPNYRSQFVHRDFNVEVKTNSDGFRDDEYVHNKPENIKRVVSLGDSFTWGWGVENDEVYMQVAESLLDGVEFINMGQNGYGTGQELLLFAGSGKSYSPDLVTLGFVDNDLTDNVAGRGKPLFDLNDGHLEVSGVSETESLEIRIKSFFVKNSYLFVLANYGYQRFERWLKQLGSSRSSNRGAVTSRYERYLKTASTEQSRQWKIFEKLILKLKEDSGDNLMIIYIPHRIEVEYDTDGYKQIVSSEIYDVDVMRERIKRLCEERDIIFLSLTERFRESYKAGSKLYFDHDGHMTKAGHEVAGNALATKVSEFFRAGGQ